MNRTDKIVDALFEYRPLFHGDANAGTRNFSIAPDVIRWMIKSLPKGGVTLETGCGYSTVVFAALSAKHIAISPYSREHNMIRRWCNARGLPFSNVTCISKPSQKVIHSLPDDPLDAVLIDGDHAFPAPFIDWYYTADRLKVGGYMIVDDTQIVTGALLRDFLKSDTERWDSVIEIGKTSVFRRITDEPVAKGLCWVKQPFCCDPNTIPEYRTRDHSRIKPRIRTEVANEKART